MVKLRSLVCHKGIETYLICLKSLKDFCRDPIEMVLHNDGSLDECDKTRFIETLGPVEFVERETADEIILERLKNYKHASALRKNSIWGLELFDYHLFDESETYGFWCDADVKFIRPFSGLFTEEAAKGKSVFISDAVWQSYSIRPWHLMDDRCLNVISGMNLGLNIMDKRFYDLDYIDWFLGQDDYYAIPNWIVPTCYAALGARSNAYIIDNTQLVNLYPSAKITQQTFAAHFLSSYREQWKNELLKDNSGSMDLEPLSVRFERAKVCSPLELLRSQIERKINNLRN